MWRFIVGQPLIRSYIFRTFYICKSIIVDHRETKWERSIIRRSKDDLTRLVDHQIDEELGGFKGWDGRDTKTI